MPTCPELRCTGLGIGAWPGGEGRSRSGGPGGSQERDGGGTGRLAELESAGTGRGFPRRPLLPRAPGGRVVHAGLLARGGPASPYLVGFREAGCFMPLLALLRGFAVSLEQRAGG